MSFDDSLEIDAMGYRARSGPYRVGPALARARSCPIGDPARPGWPAACSAALPGTSEHGRRSSAQAGEVPAARRRYRDGMPVPDA